MSPLCLTLPISRFLCASAFAQGGTLLSCIVLFFTALQSDITATFVLEACARAEALRNAELSSRHCSAELSLDSSRHAESLDTSQHSAGSSPRRKKERLPRNYSMAIRKHTYQLSELCRIFLGDRARIFFTFTTALDLNGITWAIAAIFGTTMADQLPMTGTDNGYYYYLLIFGAITIPLACVPIIDQCWVQMCFLAARTVMVLFMICTVAVGYASSVPQFGTQAGPAKDVPLADFSNLIVLIQICIFSTAFQFAVPGMAGASLNKKIMLEIFGSAVMYIFVTNLLVGLMLAIYFGKDGIAESSNLNWLDYHGGTWDGSGNVESERAGWANFIANYVVLFAAVDGVAVFPLIAVSLGDILLGAVYGEKAHVYHDDWKRRTAFRLLASIPQTVLAMFVSDLSAM